MRINCRNRSKKVGCSNLSTFLFLFHSVMAQMGRHIKRAPLLTPSLHQFPLFLHNPRKLRLINALVSPQSPLHNYCLPNMLHASCVGLEVAHILIGSSVHVIECHSLHDTRLRTLEDFYQIVKRAKIHPTAWTELYIHLTSNDQICSIAKLVEFYFSAVVKSLEPLFGLKVGTRWILKETKMSCNDRANRN